MCGVIGIAAENEVVGELYDGLATLQHRGQDSAGMVTFDGQKFHDHRGTGLVREAFNRDAVERLRGSIGLGHVRYPTAGTNDVSESQPFFVNSPFGLALVHNGNLTNPNKLAEELRKKELRHLNTSSDSEVLLNVLAREIRKQNFGKFSTAKLFAAVGATMKRIRGSYAVITLVGEHGLLAFRDPTGLRPLVLGKRKGRTKNEFCVASEDIALAVNGFEKVRDVEAGEAVFISTDGKLSTKKVAAAKWAPCIFEYVYLARPDSTIDGISVYKSRLRAGVELAAEIKKANLEIDTVVPVPDTSRTAALAVAGELGVRFREGLIKNRYIGRTFIMPTQAARKKSIRHKLIPIGLELRKKNVLLVDDSIVRGNTSRQLIEMVRGAGAKKVYLASASPALVSPCVYGVDLPTKKEFIANGLTHEQIRKQIGCDALFYLPLTGLKKACQHKDRARKYCTACFDGKYPTSEVTAKYLKEVEDGRGCKPEDEGEGRVTLF